MTRLDKILVVAAVAIYLAIGGWLTEQLPVYHEEVAIWPNNAPRIVPDDAVLEAGELGLPLEERCGSDDGALWALSQTRPSLMVCAGDTALPLMTMSYASGVFNWPLGFVTEPFARRKLTLVYGLLALLLTWLVAARLCGTRFASVSVFCIAVSPSFVVLWGWGVDFETVPWILGMGGCTIAFVRKPGALSQLRLFGACAFFGMATLANIKSIFLLGPFLLLLWRKGLLPTKHEDLRTAGCGFALPLVPILILNVIAPARGASFEVVHRLGMIKSNLSLEHIVNEPLNLLSNWGDFIHIVFLATDQPTSVSFLALFVSGAAALWVLVSAVRFMWTGSGNPFEAYCGLVLMGYLAVGTLLYDQYPPSNYAPLGAIFGLSMAGLIIGIARRLDSRAWVIAVLTVLLAAPYVHSNVNRGSLREHLHFSMNNHAVASLVEGLDELEPETLLTTSYNMAAVLDTFEGGRFEPIQVHNYLLFITESGESGEEPESIQERWQRLLPRLPGPVFVLVSARIVPVDEDRLEELLPALEMAAAELDRPIEVAGSYSAGDGTEVLRLLRIDPAVGTSP